MYIIHCFVVLINALFNRSEYVLSMCKTGIEMITSFPENKRKGWPGLSILFYLAAWRCFQTNYHVNNINILCFGTHLKIDSRRINFLKGVPFYNGNLIIATVQSGTHNMRKVLRVFCQIFYMIFGYFMNSFPS